MKATPLDPARLDVAAFARAGAQIEGRMPIDSMPRLAAGTLAPADGAAGEANWMAQGSFKQPAGGGPQLRLHLRADAVVWLGCQRCLQPVAQRLEVDRRFLFVPGEEEAERLDEESDDEDVLALPRVLRVQELIEDELILALPLVPRHERCPEPLLHDTQPDGAEPAEDVAAAPHPFAALATLKRSPGS